MNANKIISALIGEASPQPNMGLKKATKDLADILNRFATCDVEDTSPYPGTQSDDDDPEVHANWEVANPNWFRDPEYDTSEESSDLAEFRSAVFGWVESAKGLVGQDSGALRAIDTINIAVRHYMRHETRDCMYNISQPWAEFLEDSNSPIRLEWNDTKNRYEAKVL
jgi:hypothetical protein